MGKAHSKAVVRQRVQARGDRRLALLSGGCTALGSACLLLAACGSNPNKPTPLAAAPAHSSEPAMAPTVAALPAQLEPAPILNSSLWTRLRQRSTASDCDFNPAVTSWTHRWSRDPAGFSASLSQAMPFLLVVMEQ